mgnify:FL=1
MSVNSVNERIRNLGMMATFYERAGTMKSLPAEKAIPLTLGIFAFILSKMLNGELGSTIDEIEEHVHLYYTTDDWQPDRDKLLALIMRMMYRDRESGLPFSFFDFEAGELKKIKYSFLKVEHGSNESGNRISLTKTGRDMLFQTREIYQELRITMDLLFIKEQFKRGAFSRAIRSAESLKASVQDSLEEKERLLFEIKRAPWRVKAVSLNESYADVERQFDQEAEQFDELIALINNTDHTEMDDKKGESLVRLERILNESRRLHEKLFKLHLSIFPDYMNFRNKSTLRLLLGDLSFSTDLIDPLFQAPLKNIRPDTLFSLPRPTPKLFFPWLTIIRNPVKGERRMKRKIQIEEAMPDEETLQREKTFQRERIEFLTFILKALKESEPLLLSDTLHFFPPDDNLLAFIIGLHQSSPVVFNKIKDMDILQAVRNANISYKGLTVCTGSEILRKNNYRFSEYIFERI